jgi:hypothetical protein
MVGKTNATKIAYLLHVATQAIRRTFRYNG